MKTLLFLISSVLPVLKMVSDLQKALNIREIIEQNKLHFILYT